MASPFDRESANADIFLAASNGGTTATYTVLSGSPVTIPVLFAEGFDETSGMANTTPFVFTKTANVPQAGSGDTLLIGSTTYVVIRSEKDGIASVTMLMMQRQ